jgi:hypothetical protein
MGARAPWADRIVRHADVPPGELVADVVVGVILLPVRVRGVP